MGDSDKHFTVYVECRVQWPLKDTEWPQVWLYASKYDSFLMKILEQDMLLFCRDMNLSPPCVFKEKKGSEKPHWV